MKRDENSGSGSGISKNSGIIDLTDVGTFSDIIHNKIKVKKGKIKKIKIVIASLIVISLSLAVIGLIVGLIDLIKLICKLI
jgi:hypothetical protein